MVVVLYFSLIFSGWSEMINIFVSIHYLVTTYESYNGNNGYRSSIDDLKK